MAAPPASAPNQRRARVSVLGDLFCDVVATNVAALPEWGGDARTDSVGMYAGGSAANVASHLRSLARSRADGADADVTLFAALGETGDAVEHMLARHLREAGVELDAVRVPGTTIGTCIVLSGASDRAFVSCSGSTGALRLADLPLDRVADADHLHVGGVFMLHSLSRDLGAMLDRVLERNPHMTVSLDTNFDGSGAWGRDYLPDVIRRVHVVKLNEAEAMGVSGAESAEEAARRLARLAKTAAVVTLGKRGCVACSRDGRVVRVPAPRVPRVVDSTGAGDAFSAGLLSEWLASPVRDADACLRATRFAVRSGAAAATHVGACATLLTHAGVDALCDSWDSPASSGRATPAASPTPPPLPVSAPTA